MSRRPDPTEAELHRDIRAMGPTDGRHYRRMRLDDRAPFPRVAAPRDRGQPRREAPAVTADDATAPPPVTAGPPTGSTRPSRIRFDAPVIPPVTAGPPTGSTRPSRIRFDAPVIPPAPTTAPRRRWRTRELRIVVGLAIVAVMSLGAAAIAIVTHKPKPDER